jgi:hypothetical protein
VQKRALSAAKLAALAIARVISAAATSAPKPAAKAACGSRKAASRDGGVEAARAGKESPGEDLSETLLPSVIGGSAQRSIGLLRECVNCRTEPSEFCHCAAAYASCSAAHSKRKIKRGCANAKRDPSL